MITIPNDQEASMEISNPQELALHGLLLSAAARQQGHSALAMQRIQAQAAWVGKREAAALEPNHSLVDDDHLLLAQAIIDHQASPAQVQVWRHLQIQHPRLAHIADQLRPPAMASLVGRQPSEIAENGLLDGIINSIPGHRPPRPWLVPVAPIVGLLLLVSAAAAIALARAPDPAALHFLLLLFNAAFMTVGAAIALRALRSPLATIESLTGRMGATPPPSRFSQIIHARLPPAHAPPLLLGALLVP
ncbi:MAG: hypothetical protein EA401_00445, partial [Planctomycetota bacterium]